MFIQLVNKLYVEAISKQSTLEGLNINLFCRQFLTNFIRCQSLKYENGFKHTGGTWRQFSFFLIIQLSRRQVSPVLKSIFIYRTLKLKLHYVFTKSHYTI